MATLRAGKGSKGQSQEGSVTVNIGDFINHHTFLIAIFNKEYFIVKGLVGTKRVCIYLIK